MCVWQLIEFNFVVCAFRLCCDVLPHFTPQCTDANRLLVNYNHFPIFVMIPERFYIVVGWLVVHLDRFEFENDSEQENPKLASRCAR